MNNVIYHSPEGPKSQELFNLLNQEFSQISKSKLDLEIEENQDTLIIAFPDHLNFGTNSETINKILTSSFNQIQKFVQTRIKKKSGQIICLIDSGANGLNYNSEANTCFLASQGGFIGIVKTLTKEYSKRGIIGNVLYIDWQSINLSEIAKFVKCLLNEHSQLRGQVFALDGGKWL